MSAASTCGGELLRQPGKGRRGDHLALVAGVGILPRLENAHPLANVDEMRRCVEPDLEPRGPQDRGDHRTRAALALRAGDMDDLVLRLGIAQRSAERPHAVEAEVVGGVLDDPQPLEVAERIEKSLGAGEGRNRLRLGGRFEVGARPLRG